MKTILKSLLLAAILLMAGCAKEESHNSEQVDALRAAERYIAKNVASFIYYAKDQVVPQSGFAVRTSSNNMPMQDVITHAAENDELIYGQLVLDNEYVVYSMKYFTEEQYAEAFEEAQRTKADYILEIGSGRMVDGSRWDGFNVNQTITDGAAKIECKKIGSTQFYFVTLDFTLAGGTPSTIGKSYGKCIAQLPIYYKLRVGGYLDGAAEAVGLSDKTVMNRLEEMRRHMLTEDTDLLEGIAAGLGDYPEYRPLIYKANLFADIMRPTACSAFGVMPERSQTGETMACRTLDWPDGEIPWYGRLYYGIDYDRRGVVSPLQAITKMIYADRIIYQIGLLGIVCGITEIDATNRNMVAILDSGLKQKYSSKDKYSYVFDLANALRTETTIDKIAERLTKNPYTFNHLFLMADREGVQILENNISTLGTPAPLRALRKWDSPIGSQFSAWQYSSLIGAVNCFMLKGQPDNFKTDPEPCNPARWKQMQEAVNKILDARPQGQQKLSREDLITIQTANSGKFDPNKYDNLYNFNTLQMAQYIPAQNKLYVYLKPFDGQPASKPEYIEIPLESAK